MAYVDRVSDSLAFERKGGEAIMDPEHATATCPNCGKEKQGKSNNRSLYELARLFGWIVLPGKCSVLYCSHGCALTHNPKASEVYRARMDKVVFDTQLELAKWHQTNKVA